MISIKKNNKKDLKFKVGGHVRISKYKKNFAKGSTLNWSEDVFVIKIFKNIAPWTYVWSDLNSEEVVGTFYEKNIAKNKSKRV